VLISVMGGIISRPKKMRKCGKSNYV